MLERILRHRFITKCNSKDFSGAVIKKIQNRICRCIILFKNTLLYFDLEIPFIINLFVVMKFEVEALILLVHLKSKIDGLLLMQRIWVCLYSLVFRWSIGKGYFWKP